MVQDSSDMWSWDREHFTEIVKKGNHHTHDPTYFEMLHNLSATREMWISREGVSKRVLPSGLTVYTRRGVINGVTQIQTLVTSDEGEVLDFTCDPTSNELPRAPRLTQAQIVAKLKEKGNYPTPKRRRGRSS